MSEPAAALSLDREQQKHLEALVRSGQTPQKVLLRARILLLASQGKSNRSIAKKLGTSRPTVYLWRARFRKAGVPGLLRGGKRAGRKAKKSKRGSR